MGLTEKEQQMLADIERRFNEEEEDDPRVNAPPLPANNTVVSMLAGLLLAGMLTVLIFFTSQLLVALTGVAIMVGAGVFLVHILRPRIRLRLDQLYGAHRRKPGIPSQRDP